MSSEVTFTVKFPQNAPPTLTPVALKLLNKRKEAENVPSRPQSQQHYEEWPSRKQGMPTRQPNTFRQPPVQSDRMLQDREENHFPVQRAERARSSRATFPIRQAGPSEWQPPRRPRYDDQNGYLSDGDVPLTRPNPRISYHNRQAEVLERDAPRRATNTFQNGYLSDGNVPLNRTRQFRSQGRAPAPPSRLPVKDVQMEARIQSNRQRIQADAARRRQEQRSAAVAQSRSRSLPRGPALHAPAPAHSSRC